MSQMRNVEVVKTSCIAKLRILVEQLTGKVKSLRILSAEIPVTLIPQIDNILLVCAALTNMKEPMFKD